MVPNKKTNIHIYIYIYMCQGLNSHDFHIIGDGKLNPIVGVYIPIKRIPIKGGMTIPNTTSLDPGTYIYIYYLYIIKYNHIFIYII